MEAKKFGTFISDRRKSLHMTQADLAGKIGVTDKAVSRWERGLGFPDINTMEPLADALGLSLLELMRSEKIETEGKTESYTREEAAELMKSVEEMRKQQLHQDKVAGYLAVPVILIVAAIFKLSGHASLGGAIFAGLLGAGAVICAYYLWENRSDGESRRIYGFFTVTLTGIFLALGSLLLPDSFWDGHAQAVDMINCLISLGIIVYGFGNVIHKQYLEKKNPVKIAGCAMLALLLTVWTLHNFAGKSAKTAVGMSRGNVAEQYASQLLVNEKQIEEDWIQGYSYYQIDLHPDVYRVGFSYYADEDDMHSGNESVYGYDIQVDSDYKITIKDESTAIGEDMWSENEQDASETSETKG